MSQSNAKNTWQVFLLQPAAPPPHPHPLTSILFKEVKHKLNINEIKTHMPTQDICRENSHGEAAAAQLTDWLADWHTCTHLNTHTHTTSLLIPCGILLSTPPLCMHSPFLSLTVPHSHVCFLLNPYFPLPQTTLKINIVALIQLEKTWCTSRCVSESGEGKSNLDHFSMAESFYVHFKQWFILS